MGGRQSRKNQELTIQQTVSVDVNNPWRSFEKDGNWNSDYQDRLLAEVIQQNDKRETKNVVQYPRILVLGKSKAGKSSFINSAFTIDKGEISFGTVVDTTHKTTTTKQLIQIPLHQQLGLWMMDTMGLDDVQEVLVQDIKLVIDGKIKTGYTFDTRTAIDAFHGFYKRTPSLADKIHCVVVVVDAITIITDAVTEDGRKKIRHICDYAKNNKVPTVFLLTKVDMLDTGLKENITLVHCSTDVARVVQRTKDMFQVEDEDIYPIRNYRQTGLDTNMNILLLLALRRISLQANNYILESSKT